MSCGACPGDRFDSGLSIRSRMSAYSGAERGGGYGACAQRASVAHYLQNANAQQTTYGREGVKMRSYRPSYRASQMPVVYKGVGQYVPPDLEVPVRLEEIVAEDARDSLEARLQPGSPVSVESEEAEIVYRAQAVDERRRALAREIERLRERQVA